MKKSKIKLGLSILSVIRKLRFANKVIEAITGNSNFDPAEVSLVEITAKRDEMRDTLSTRDAAKAAAKGLTEDLDASELEFDDSMKSLAVVVETVAGGDAGILESGGFDTYVPGDRTPAEALDPVTGLVATPGNAAGKVDLSWDSLSGADSYMVYISTTPGDESSWVVTAGRKQSLATIIGLDTGTVYWFRVTGIGTEGEGPPSDPATSVAR